MFSVSVLKDCFATRVRVACKTVSTSAPTTRAAVTQTCPRTEHAGRRAVADALPPDQTECAALLRLRPRARCEGQESAVCSRRLRRAHACLPHAVASRSLGLVHERVGVRQEFLDVGGSALERNHADALMYEAKAAGGDSVRHARVGAAEATAADGRLLPFAPRPGA